MDMGKFYSSSDIVQGKFCSLLGMVENKFYYLSRMIDGKFLVCVNTYKHLLFYILL